MVPQMRHSVAVGYNAKALIPISQFAPSATGRARNNDRATNPIRSIVRSWIPTRDRWKRGRDEILDRIVCNNFHTDRINATDESLSNESYSSDRHLRDGCDCGSADNRFPVVMESVPID